MMGVSLLGQSSYDILGVPASGKDAALGINHNPIARPVSLSYLEDQQVTLSAWSWIADIQGAYLGIDLDRTHMSVRSVNFGEFEYRDDIPTEAPISTFGYSLFSLGTAYAHDLEKFTLGISGELVYERTLNASSTGLSINMAAAYPLHDQLLLSTGLRHLGTSTELDSVATTLPAELWLGADYSADDWLILAELSSGSYPVAVGASYTFAGILDVMGGMQIEFADPSLRLHPSMGFSASWANFTLGYTNYQMSHRLGPRHYLSLYWSY